MPRTGTELKDLLIHLIERSTVVAADEAEFRRRLNEVIEKLWGFGDYHFTTEIRNIEYFQPSATLYYDNATNTPYLKGTGVGPFIDGATSVLIKSGSKIRTSLADTVANYFNSPDVVASSAEETGDSTTIANFETLDDGTWRAEITEQYGPGHILSTLEGNGWTDSGAYVYATVEFDPVGNNWEDDKLVALAERESLLGLRYGDSQLPAVIYRREHEFNSGGIGEQPGALGIVADLGPWEVEGTTLHLYRIPNDLTKMVGLVKKAPPFLTALSEKVYPDNINAIKYGILATMFEEENDLERADAYWAAARRTLDEELDSIEGVATAPMSISPDGLDIGKTSFGY